MPIYRTEFEEAPLADLRTGRDQTHVETVRSFLDEHSDRAFTLREIRETTDVPRGCVGRVLTRLEDNGDVLHRGEYWASAGDRDRR